jgi:hypothetical protein
MLIKLVTIKSREMWILWNALKRGLNNERTTRKSRDEAVKNPKNRKRIKRGDGARMMMRTVSVFYRQFTTILLSLQKKGLSDEIHQRTKRKPKR